MNKEFKSFLKIKDVLFRGYEILEESVELNYTRRLIQYQGSEDDPILAYLYSPKSNGKHPAVLIHHQHNGERHYGKSEVAGIVGDPFQAFGPALAERGFVVLAPDSLCFEDRRLNKKGTLRDTEEKDWLQHFNEMTHRLTKGETLMRKILEDAGIAITLLESELNVNKSYIGILGHSYGGNTVIFQSAIDERIKYACTSGAVCSYKNKFLNKTGLEMALAIPNIYPEYEFDKILASVAPRSLLIVSAENDKYSKDANEVVEAAKNLIQTNLRSSIEHKRYPGGHPLDEERFKFIIEWIGSQGRAL